MGDVYENYLIIARLYAEKARLTKLCHVYSGRTKQGKYYRAKMREVLRKIDSYKR